MKDQEHYLGRIMCPLNRSFDCSSNCAWFDHEEQDCRKILTQKNILYELRKLNKNIFDGFDALFQKV